MKILDDIKQMTRVALANAGLRNDFEFDVQFGKPNGGFDITTNVALKYPRKK